MLNALAKTLSSVFGLGYIPILPGTFGTAVGSLLFYWLRGRPPTLTSTSFIYFTLISAFVSIVIAHWGEKAFKKKDSRHVVIDEVVGVLCCYALVPYSVHNLVLGFILFRLFDIAKIFPANWAQDKLPGGLGVVGDDLIAGLQAGLILWALPAVTDFVSRALTFL